MEESLISLLLFIFIIFRVNEEFNNVVVLISRYLDVNEFFEVRVDKYLIKWVGLLEIGVIIYDLEILEFLLIMINV